MRLGKGLGRKISSGAAVAGVLSLVQSAWAQGCVMCYTSASALNKNAAHELDKAIITLFIPPALMFGGIFFYIYKRRAAWRTVAMEETHADLGAGAHLRVPSRTHA